MGKPIQKLQLESPSNCRELTLASNPLQAEVHCRGDPPTFGVFPVCEQDDPEKPGCSGFVPFLFSVWFLRPCRAAAGLGVRLHREHLRNKIREDVERERASTMNIDDLSTAMSKTSAPQTYGNASAFPGLVGVGGIVTPCK